MRSQYDPQWQGAARLKQSGNRDGEDRPNALGLNTSKFGQCLCRRIGLLEHVRQIDASELRLNLGKLCFDLGNVLASPPLARWQPRRSEGQPSCKIPGSR
jgi:hypothetical protein